MERYIPKDLPIVRNRSNSTVDDHDVSHHSKLHDDWWDLDGLIGPLHSLNPLRVKLIRDGLASVAVRGKDQKRSLEGVKILDVGCGGGILSECLARLGAQTTGLDASKELIDLASERLESDKSIAANLSYVNSSIEEYAEDNENKYDVVVASEIIEHVHNRELFLQSCVKVSKSNGLLVITTPNRTFLSWIIGVIVYEYILKVIPIGTHEWNKFTTPGEMRLMLDKCGSKIKHLCGFFYNPFVRKWTPISSTSLWYGLYAVKQGSINENN